MRLYYWDGPGPDKKNWGDQLNPFILSKMNQDFEHADPKDAELVIIGSILEHLPYGWRGTICGVGKLYQNNRIYLGDARVFALRGHLTLAGVTGLKTTPVLGDPGLLVSRFVPQPVAKHHLGILPHWRDHDLYRRFNQGHLIDPFQPPEKVIKEIASCKQLITSSLHGIIVADAFGIPRQAELFARAETEGGDFKYRDYTSVYEEHPHFGHMHRPPRHKIEKIQDDLYRALQIAVGIDLPDAVESRRSPQLSLLVPFRDDGEHRSRVWRWLRRHWRMGGMNAEIIQGWDYHPIFSKAVAINNAASLARGRILALLDADAYLDPAVLTASANQLDESIIHQQRTWHMPYRRLYRLNEGRTLAMLGSNPPQPPLTAVPLPEHLEAGGFPYVGHQYGAMAQVMPIEAFKEAEGMDPRMRGWGGEDVSFLNAVDALWGHHEVCDNQIMHLWHAKIGNNHLTRQWVGQPWIAPNSRLGQRYTMAIGEPKQMRGLADEHPLDW